MRDKSYLEPANRVYDVNASEGTLALLITNIYLSKSVRELCYINLEFNS